MTEMKEHEMFGLLTLYLAFALLFATLHERVCAGFNNCTTGYEVMSWLAMISLLGAALFILAKLVAGRYKESPQDR